MSQKIAFIILILALIVSYFYFIEQRDKKLNALCPDHVHKVMVDCSTQ